MNLTKTQICNLALSHIGVTKNISNVDTENSVDAEQCRQFFPIALKESLEECRFSVAQNTKSLELITEEPLEEWDYAYRYPADCLFVDSILRDNDYNGLSYTNRTNAIKEDGLYDVEYIVSYFNGDKVIFTNQENARIRYTKNVDIGAKFSAKFEIGLSYLLALYIAPTVSKGRQGNYEARLMRMYKMKMEGAQALNFNESGSEEVDDRSQIELWRRGY